MGWCAACVRPAAPSADRLRPFLPCHRDIKPQNLLVNINTHALKLCDFGSAKTLVRGEPNISYICSRYYRAPELIFGATDYTCAIDVRRHAHFATLPACALRLLQLAMTVVGFPHSLLYLTGRLQHWIDLNR